MAYVESDRRDLGKKDVRNPNNLHFIGKCDLFPKLRGALSVKEKLKFKADKARHNYFVGLDLDRIDMDPENPIPDEIRPKRKVTAQLLKYYMSKNEFIRDRKLCWVIDNFDKPFTQEFKEKFDNNRFKNMADAQTEACKIYAQNCENYQPLKAVVTRGANGGRVVEKKEDRNRTATAVVDNDSDDIRRYKASCLQKLAASANAIKEILTMKTWQLKQQMAQESDSFKYALENYGKIPCTNADRKTVCIMALMYEIINNS